MCIHDAMRVYREHLKDPDYYEKDLLSLMDFDEFIKEKEQFVSVSYT